MRPVRLNILDTLTLKIDLGGVKCTCASFREDKIAVGSTDGKVRVYSFKGPSTSWIITRNQQNKWIDLKSGPVLGIYSDLIVCKRGVFDFDGEKLDFRIALDKDEMVTCCCDEGKTYGTNKGRVIYAKGAKVFYPFDIELLMISLKFKVDREIVSLGYDRSKQFLFVSDKTGKCGIFDTKDRVTPKRMRSEEVIRGVKRFLCASDQYQKILFFSGGKGIWRSIGGRIDKLEGVDVQPTHAVCCNYKWMVYTTRDKIVFFNTVKRESQGEIALLDRERVFGVYKNHDDNNIFVCIYFL